MPLESARTMKPPWKVASQSVGRENRGLRRFCLRDTWYLSAPTPAYASVRYVRVIRILRNAFMVPTPHEAHRDQWVTIDVREAVL